MTSDSILVFGGTFDPPHRAHIELPPRIARELGCVRLLYVPTSVNPLKDESATPAHHRLAMLEIALADVPQAEICTIELDHEGPSYTVDTLRELRASIGDRTRVYLLIGADAALSFQRWREPAAILEMATPVVMLRPPFDETTFRAALREAGADDHLVQQWIAWTVSGPRLDISATEIRRRLQCGNDLTGMLTPEVLQYIRTHELYEAERV